MTAADRALALAQARRFRCTQPGCDVTLPSRVLCVPRADGRYDVRVEVDQSAQLRHRLAAHVPAAPTLRRVS
jgi:hypothetical protein